MTEVVAHYIKGPKLEIRPCALDREWMQHAKRFVYKCLPVTQANQLGWEILANVDIVAEWTGDFTTHGVIIHNRSSQNDYVASHFGNGIVTFNLPYVFSTPRGMDLWVRGPSNPDPAYVQALEGVVETWWNPFTFTMNWRFLVAGKKHVFRAGEPICRFVPFPHHYLDDVELVCRNLADDPVRAQKYQQWSESRRVFSHWQMQDPGKRLGGEWQKHYYHGVDFTASAEPIDGHKVGWGLSAPGKAPSRFAVYDSSKNQLTGPIFLTYEEAHGEAKKINGVPVEITVAACGGDCGGCPSAAPYVDEPPPHAA